MVARTWTAATTLALATAVALAGCTGGERACPAPYASIAPAVEPGTSLTLNLENLFNGCNDTGEWFADDGPLKSVTVELIDTSGNVEESAESPVDAEGKATVVLRIPADATGRYEVHAADYAIGAVEVGANAS